MDTRKKLFIFFAGIFVSLFLIISLIRFLGNSNAGSESWFYGVTALFQKTFSSKETLVEEISLLPPASIDEEKTLPNLLASSPLRAPKEDFSGLYVSEVMAGKAGNALYEFIEFYNASERSIPLDGLLIRKRNMNGVESTLVPAKKFGGSVIAPTKYFLLANEGGYDGESIPDIFWAKSNTLAYASNSIALYSVRGEKLEEVVWQELIPDKSFARTSWAESVFVIATPTPKNADD